MKKLFLSSLFFLSCYCLLAQVNRNIDFRSEVHYPNACSDIWGYVDDVGNEYALVGTWEGVSIVDVTKPDTPKVKFNVPSAVPKNGNTVWREIKTFNKHAYVTNEQDSGLFIIDLSGLPGNVTYHHFTSHGLKTAHDLWVDEHGILYLFGYNTYIGVPQSNAGAMIFDLKNNPDQPQYVSEYTNVYIHDGFVRGDTLWASEIFQGQLAVINVKNKNSFKVMALKTTPLAFCHNAWPTSDNHYVFTTDEKPNSSLSSFDVSNLNSIPPVLDKVQSNPGSSSIIHNVTLWTDDFAVCSYYRDGVVIFDVTHPDNMIEVGSYDTSPLSGNGFNGDWGVYPYLPSHNVILSDMEGGLFVLTPHYKHACWLEGTVTDSITHAVLNGVTITSQPVLTSQTDYLGEYKTGTADSGFYDVQVSKPGYIPKVIHHVSLQHGIITTLDVQLADSSLINNYVVIPKEQNAQMALFPNPFNLSSQLHYEIPFSAGHNQLVIMDLTGRIVFRKQLLTDSGNMNIGNKLLPGIYFISVEADNRLIQIIKAIKF